MKLCPLQNTTAIRKMNVRWQKVGKTVSPLGLPSKAGGMWEGLSKESNRDSNERMTRSLVASPPLDRACCRGETCSWLFKKLCWPFRLTLQRTDSEMKNSADPSSCAPGSDGPPACCASPQSASFSPTRPPTSGQPLYSSLFK